MSNPISEERKSLYKAGLVLSIIGGCMFGMPFLVIPIIIFTGITQGDPGDSVVLAPIAFIGAFIGFAMIAGGGFMRSVAARGKAGSGLTLDPEQARKDLEPWSRMTGGMVKDTLDEAGINLDEVGKKFMQGNSPQPQKVVMLKCIHCGRLNEEDSKFCQECGKPF